MIAESNDPILFTGATGFMGHYVLRELLQRGRRLVVLVRPPLEAAAQRLGAMLREIGLDVEEHRAAGRLELVAGAIPDALPAPTWGPTSAIIHCAASLQLFANGNRDPEVTNLEGTRAIIDWARRSDVRRIHAVSTAYTCGWNTGTIRSPSSRPITSGPSGRPSASCATGRPAPDGPSPSIAPAS